MKGQKYCRHLSDIKVVCPKCSKRYFFPVADYKGTAMFEALKTEEPFELVCPWCWDNYSSPEGSMIIDLSSTQEWYGDSDKKPPLKEIYDVMYFEDDRSLRREFETEIQKEFPSIRLEDASDGIHGARTALYLGGELKRKYMKWLIEKGYANSSFLINMVLTSKSFKKPLQYPNFEEEYQMLKDIVAELEPKN